MNNNNPSFVVFYDNDKTGLSMMERIRESTGLRTIHIPEEYYQKDISDFIRDNGKQAAVKLLKQLLEI